MYPEPPRRSDSAKYSSSSLPKRPALSPIAFDEFKGSVGLPNFVVEPLPRESSATSGTVPPLSSYSSAVSTKNLNKSTIATGYINNEFKGHYRHPDGTNSMVNLTNFSNTHPIPPKKDASRSFKEKVSEPKGSDFQTDVATFPKKENHLSIENAQAVSVDDFMVKLLRLDGESTLDRQTSQDRIYSRNPYLPLNIDGQKESIHDLLKVTLLEAEELSEDKFYPPKSHDIDQQLKSSREVYDKPLERQPSITAPPRGSSNFAFKADISSTLNSSSSSLGSSESRSNNISSRGQKKDIQQIIYQNSSKSLPAPLQIYTQHQYTNSNVGSIYDSDLSLPLSNQNPILEKSATVDSASSSFDQLSISGDSARSIALGTEGYRPTFQTLRRNKSLKEESSQENLPAIPSDAAFSEMKENVKKSNNQTAQFDFAKYCIQLGDPYAEIGLSFLQKLAKSGFADAQFVLGQAYADDKRYDIALRYFAAATKRNNYEAAYEAACLCENGGPGIKTNEREALNYYTKAGLAGHKKAMYRLALAELYGQLGLKRNINNGMKWLNRGESVADKDCPEPLYELSLIYEVGIYPVVISDSDHSFSLLKQAADLEYPPAQYKLGYCHEYGYLGVPIDKSNCIMLYQKSAKAGNKEAQLALSGWLITGYEPVISRNDREALYWAHLSALQGLARAEYTMGYFLESGIGASPNISEALKWYKIASSKGDEIALKRLSEIESHLPKSPRKSKFKFF